MAASEKTYLQTHPILLGYIRFFFTLSPFIFHDPAGAEFCQILLTFVDFRYKFCNVVRTRYFQFATHDWSHVNKFHSTVFCKTTAYPSLTCTLQVTKSGAYNRVQVVFEIVIQLVWYDIQVSQRLCKARQRQKRGGIMITTYYW
jgi:hypothetical protein